MTEEHMFASRNPSISRLDIKSQFAKLGEKEKLYAHHMSRAAWLGARIIFRQVSPESDAIYDLIIELYRSCGGDWKALANRTGVSPDELDHFLGYAATFLGNVGNYYGSGDQKFVPPVSKEFLEALASVTPNASALCCSAILAPKPGSLGYTSLVAQSSYYPGEVAPTPDEISSIGRLLEQSSIAQENTRIRKRIVDSSGSFAFDVLQASVDISTQSHRLGTLGSEDVFLVKGDHSKDLARICDCLLEARSSAANETQKKFISEYVASFTTGSLELHKESQRTWVRDHKPAVETQFGFVEPYRDPFGTRAEFEGLVAVVDAEGTQVLTRLVETSERWIGTLPWVKSVKGPGRNGPFEKDLFNAPDFTAIHALAYCSSIIFLGINLPNYDDVRQTIGFKNVMVANRNRPPDPTKPPEPKDCPLIDPSEVPAFLRHHYHAWNLQVTLHELFGHGTGKLLAQDSSGGCNFDPEDPPLNPLTGKPVSTWYKAGQTWTSVFGSLATSMEECRAECIGAYLITEKPLLALFGFDYNSEITPDGIIYSAYLQLGILGLRALESYIVEDQKWGQAHDRGHFARLQVLLGAGDNFMTLNSDFETKSITVHVDRSKIISHGKKALTEMLLKLHIYRCTADIHAGKEYFEALTAVDEKWLRIREIVLANQIPGKLFVQANTFLKDGVVEVKEYAPTVDGIIQSWAERDI